MELKINLILLIMNSLFIITNEKALLVVERAQSCNASHVPSKQECMTMGVIRGETSIGLPAICYLRVDPGPCGRDLIRVYYDHVSHRCKHFSFSGCGGNANRFISIKNCYHICNPGIRRRLVGTCPPIKVGEDKCRIPQKKKVILNITQVSQVELDV